MFRRMTTLALLLAATTALASCKATDHLEISPKAQRASMLQDGSQSFRSSGGQTAASTPSAGLAATRSSGSSSSDRSVVRLGSDFEFAGLTLSPVHANALPGWRTERHGDALAAFHNSCKVLGARNPSDQASRSILGGRVSDWAGVCAQASQISVDNHPRSRSFFEDNFQAFEVRGDGTFTGYYEAELNGSRTRTNKFAWPLYKKPNDLVSEVPYMTREQIEAGALRDRGLELVYIDNPVDVFMLQIQGSGVIRFQDGTSTRVGYAANNAHPFVSLRTELENRGFDKKVYGASIQSYTRWLKERPKIAIDVMNANPRFIFFAENPNPSAIGAQGIHLTPERSMAVDLDLMPLHVPLWLETHATAPNGSRRDINRMMIAQDTGSAIKGAVRGDFFWGSGAGALAMAGRMKSPGVYTVLVPNAIAATLPTR